MMNSVLEGLWQKKLDPLRDLVHYIELLCERSEKRAWGKAMKS